MHTQHIDSYLNFWFQNSIASAEQFSVSGLVKCFGMESLPQEHRVLGNVNYPRV